MKKMLQKIASQLPPGWQQALKRIYFGMQIRNNSFVTNEKEFLLLPDLLSPSNWVLDIGANVGHYTARFSELVKESGRVIAFEPVTETFELLAANAARLRYRNLTLLNAAASEQTELVGMSLPKFASGLDNFYMASISHVESDFHVLTLAIDSLDLPNTISLVKIDAEGHELSVIKGMVNLLRRDMPVMIIEDNSPLVVKFLEGLGYSHTQIDGSPNRIFRATSN